MDIISKLIKFRDDRNWQKYHTAEFLSRALMVEAGELNELFLWGAVPDETRVKEEVADCLIYAINLCIARGFDIEEIINAKIDKNAIKYPPSLDIQRRL